MYNVYSMRQKAVSTLNLERERERERDMEREKREIFFS